MPHPGATTKVYGMPQPPSIPPAFVQCVPTYLPSSCLGGMGSNPARVACENFSTDTRKSLSIQCYTHVGAGQNYIN